MTDERTRAQIPWRIVEFMMMVILVESGQISRSDALDAIQTNGDMYDYMRDQLIETAQGVADDGIRQRTCSRSRSGVSAAGVVGVRS